MTHEAPVTHGAGEAGWSDLSASVDRIAAEVLRCAGVVALSSKGHRPVATYLPGRQVSGVQLEGDRIRVGVVGAMGVPIPVLAAQVRAAVAPLAHGRAVDVDVVDIQPLPAGRVPVPPPLGG